MCAVCSVGSCVRASASLLESVRARVLVLTCVHVHVFMRFVLFFMCVSVCFARTFASVVVIEFVRKGMVYKC